MPRHQLVALRYAYAAICCALIVSASCLLSLSLHAQSIAEFSPLDQWRAAILGGDAARLRALYSATPPARIETPEGPGSTASEVAFWLGGGTHSLTAVRMEEVQSTELRPGIRQIIARAELAGNHTRNSHTEYANVALIWEQQGTTWHIAASKRVTGRTRLRQPLATRDLYPAGRNARAEIQNGLQRAAAGHKNLLVVFGAA